MALRFRRGVGDVLNPTAGTSLNCGLFHFGVFNKACWCLQFPSLCGQADYVASRALADPTVYAAIKAPPAVGAPSGAALTTPPADEAQAQAQVDAILAQQVSDWKAQNAATIAETQANLDRVASEQPPFCLFGSATQAADGTWTCDTGGTNWLLYVGLGLVAVFAAVTMGGGSPRRYGR